MGLSYAVLLVAALAACGQSPTPTTKVSFAGSSTVVGNADGGQPRLRLYGAKDLVTADAPKVLAETDVDADGGWSAPSVDVTAVNDGLVVLSNGSEFLFPTISGVVNYSNEATKTDKGDARTFVVSREEAGRVAALLGRPELLDSGFVMGVVTDGAQPLAGARVSAGGVLALNVYYLSPDLKSVSRTETSASGLFVVAADPALLFLDLDAAKSGHAFSTTIAPLKSGACSFAVVQQSADSPTVRIKVGGTVTSLDSTTVVGATVEVLSPYDLVNSAGANALDGGAGRVVGGDVFDLESVDVTDVSQGVLARVTGTGLYPTVSGLTQWASEADVDKVAMTQARVFAVSATLVTTLATKMPAATLLAEGFVMGVVSDGTMPVAGAVVGRVDGKALTVLYPDSTFTRFDGTATSASGLFVLGPGQAVSQVSVTATKAGWSFRSTTLLQSRGQCYFAALVPDISHPPVTINVSGIVTPFGAASVGGATLSVFAPYDFARALVPISLMSTSVTSTSTFSAPAIVVTNVSGGLFAEVSDNSGRLYATVSGLTQWASEADADKKGLTSAQVFATPLSLAQELATGLGQPTLLATGFILGVVTDGSAGVAGARVSRVDGRALVVLYPDSTFSAFGASTSATGLFLIVDQSGLSQVSILATAGSVTFGPVVLVPRPGTCFAPVLRPR